MAIKEMPAGNLENVSGLNTVFGTLEPILSSRRIISGRTHRLAKFLTTSNSQTLITWTIIESIETRYELTIRTLSFSANRQYWRYPRQLRERKTMTQRWFMRLITTTVSRS